MAQIRTHHTEVSKCTDRSAGTASTDFKVSRHYINTSSHDFTVIHRNGLPVRFARTADAYNNRKITIRDVYTFNSRTQIVSTISALQTRRTQMDAHPELDIILTALLEAASIASTQTVSVAVDHSIDINILVQYPCIYFTDTDVLIQLGEYRPDIPHPYSLEGLALDQYHPLITERKCSGVFVELIDNENTIQSRYLYVANHLMEIPVRTDPSRPSGVYYSEASCTATDEIHVSPTYCTFDEAESALGLYSTKEAALTGGNPELAFKHSTSASERDLIQARQDLERIKSESRLQELSRLDEIAAIKHEQELRLNELKSQMADIEHRLLKKKKRNDHLKEEYDGRKTKRDDYYDERSSHRRESVEWTKYAPAIVIGTIGALAYWGKKA